MKDTIRARYTLEFKQEAIRLVQSGERVSTVAATLGVSSKSIDNWIKDDAAVQLSEVRSKSLSAVQMEISRLKAELSRTRMEHDILN